MTGSSFNFIILQSILVCPSARTGRRPVLTPQPSVPVEHVDGFLAGVPVLLSVRMAMGFQHGRWTYLCCHGALRLGSWA
ncbi:hypothetical protein BKA80DRAFT_264196 [Phyllosticta citrichinensis]